MDPTAPLSPEIITPHASEPHAQNPRVGSFMLSWLARLCAVAVLAACAYMFYLFAENDVGVMVLSSAFALCFGAGALAYGPLFIIARLIKQSRKTPTKQQAIWVLALSVPWFMAGLILITYPNAVRFAGGLTLILSALFILWAVKHWANIRAKSGKMSKTVQSMNET